MAEANSRRIYRTKLPDAQVQVPTIALLEPRNGVTDTV